MKKMFVVLAILVSSTVFVYSQSRYNTLRDAGLDYLKKGQFAEAQFAFDGAQEFADSEKEKVEIQSLKKVIEDSVNVVYNAAYALMSKNPEKAVMMFERLFDRTSEPMHDGLYAQMGWCYGKLKMKEKERGLYEKGVAKGEQEAAYYLARSIQDNRENISTDSLLSLYKRARNIVSAVDSAATIYYRKAQYNESYSWFTKSSSVFSKYWRATMLLDDVKIKYLADKFVEDDPIRLLSDAACANDITSAKKENRDALFYLGMLYYYAKPGDRVERDRKKGCALISKASELGHPEAKRVAKDIKNECEKHTR